MEIAIKFVCKYGLNIIFKNSVPFFINLREINLPVSQPFFIKFMR